jgi:uncharacterized protein YbcI
VEVGASVSMDVLGQHANYVVVVVSVNMVLIGVHANYVAAEAFVNTGKGGQGVIPVVV